MRFPTLSALAAAALLSTCATASAQVLSKTWVSSTGSDTGTCGISAPCGSFAYAYSQTTAGGEIEVKDSGQYGSLTISHAISIISASASATIGLNPGGNAIIVSAGANDIVTLKGLIINGHGASNTVGILVYSGKNVEIDSCTIEGITNGIYLQASSTIFVITNNYITQNGTGIVAYQNGYTVLGENKITGNQYGVYGYNSSAVYTFGDNDIAANSTADTTGLTVHTVTRF